MSLNASPPQLCHTARERCRHTCSSQILIGEDRLNINHTHLAVLVDRTKYIWTVQRASVWEEAFSFKDVPYGLGPDAESRDHEIISIARNPKIYENANGMCASKITRPKSKITPA